MALPKEEGAIDLSVVISSPQVDVVMDPVLTAIAWAFRGLALSNLTTLSVRGFYEVVMSSERWASHSYNQSRC